MSNDLLGPAERHIAAELRQTIEACRQNSQELLEAFNKIDLDSDNIEKMMLDSLGKESLIATLRPLKGIQDNLHMATLVPLVLGIAIETAGAK